MPETISYSQVCAMLRAAGEQIQAQHELLSRLDSAVGDGDHGVTMLRCMEAAAKATAENTGEDLQALFSSIAWAIMACDGGATGPLLGSLFLGMSQAVAGTNGLDQAGFTSMVEGGVAQVQKQSRAQVGDKTMMDALLPALAAMKAADQPDGIKIALQQAAAAAAQGAESTKALRAKFGRARHLGDRVIGHADPGAVSISLIFKGFSEGIQLNGKDD